MPLTNVAAAVALGTAPPVYAFVTAESSGSKTFALAVGGVIFATIPRQLRRFVQRRRVPLLAFGDSGLRIDGGEFIPWTNIEAAGTTYGRGAMNLFLRISLRTPTRGFMRGRKQLLVSLAGADKSWAEIARRFERHGVDVAAGTGGD